MEQLDLLIWLLFWPLVVDVCNYLNARKRAVFGLRPLTEHIVGVSAGIDLIIWIAGGILFYNL